MLKKSQKIIQQIYKYDCRKSLCRKNKAVNLQRHEK
nr:MAG TPA_asm: hypothetical protein [Caudoviricetes sp.]